MDIIKRCIELGAAGAAAVPIDRIVFQPELRTLCEQNVCGRFGRNYTCPPHVGEVEKLIAKLRVYRTAVIWQNIYPLEDSFDIEGMMAAQVAHNTQTALLAEEVYAAYGRNSALVLAAGGCTQCERCAMPDNEPCRHPEKTLSSLEAYGIHVASLEDTAGLKYTNGPNTVTYFSGVFVDKL